MITDILLRIQSLLKIREKKHNKNNKSKQIENHNLSKKSIKNNKERN